MRVVVVGYGGSQGQPDGVEGQEDAAEHRVVVQSPSICLFCLPVTVGLHDTAPLLRRYRCQFLKDIVVAVLESLMNSIRSNQGASRTHQLSPPFNVGALPSSSDIRIWR